MRDLIDEALADPSRIPAILAREAIEYYIKSQYEELVHDPAGLRSVANRRWEMEDSVEGLNSSLADDLAPGGPDIEHDKRLNFVFKQPSVYEIEDVVLSGPYAAGRTREGKYIPDMLGRPVTHDSLRFPLRTTLLSEWRSSVVPLDRRPASTHRTAAVIHRPSGSQNYYHWIIDHLLKLRGVEHYEERTGDSVELIVSAHMPEFAKEALELLGFGDHSITEWEGPHARVDTLVVPSWPEPTPGNLRWIRSRMTGSVSGTERETGWVYVSRQNASRGRKVANFDEIAEVLREFDVSIVRCEDLSFIEQVRLFSSVDGIVAPHGAGLTNMIWADRPSVIELFNGRVAMPFYVLADVLDHHYVPVIGTPVETSGRRKPRDRDFTVEADVLRESLEGSQS